jgi:hypothetical protein
VLRRDAAALLTRESAHRYADADCDGNRDANVYRDADAYDNADADSHRDADDYINADADADSDSHADEYAVARVV